MGRVRPDRQPMTQNQLARALKGVGVGPVGPGVLRIDGAPHRGYELAWFDDAFARYASSPSEGGSNRNPVTNADETGTSDLFQKVQTDHSNGYGSKMREVQ